MYTVQPQDRVKHATGTSPAGQTWEINVTVQLPQRRALDVNPVKVAKDSQIAEKMKQAGNTLSYPRVTFQPCHP